MAPAHEIVIIGSSFAGLNASHYLLRHVLPSLSDTTSTSYHITVVSSTTHFFWSVAAPRALISPTLLPPCKTFHPIAPAFSSYPSESFTLLHASATALDPSTREVTIQHLQDDSSSLSSSPATLHYDTLILATGASHPSTSLWSASAGPEVTTSAFSALHAALPRAHTILIAGGGPIGVETAGEIGSAFGKSSPSHHDQPRKQITILSGSSQLLPAAERKHFGATAEGYLHDLGVEVEHNLRVVSTSPSPPVDGAPTVLTLSDGSTRSVDVYIDATGLRPNTAFLPSELLDARGYVRTNPDTLRVEGAGERVYALGSCASYSNGRLGDVWDAVRPLMATLEWDLTGGKTGREGKYKKKGETLVVPVGRSKGVGVAFGWAVPSVVVWAFKGRNYMVDQAISERDGMKLKSR